MALEEVCDLLSKKLRVEKSTITMESRIQEDLGADSLDVVELLMTLEDEKGIVVSDEDALKLKTVGDIVKLIEEHKKTAK